MIKKPFCILLFCFSFCFWASWSFAANIYIDPTAGSGGDGSCVSPYDSWGDVSFSASNDYYQKCGTTWIGGGITLASITGSSGDRVILGAYYETAGPTCNIGISGAKPIINRNSTSGSGIYLNGSSYVQIENLDVRSGLQSIYLVDGSDYAVIKDSTVGLNSYGYGIRVQSSDDGKIYNCIIDSNNTYSTQDGIQLGGSSGTYADARWEIYNNEFYSWYHNMISSGSGSDDILIYYNYMDGTDCLDTDRCKGFGLGTGVRNKAHHNYIYNTNQASQLLGAKWAHVYNNVFDTVRPHTSPNTDGSFALNTTDGGASTRNNKVYNNTFYNCAKYCIYFWDDQAEADISNNEIINNIFLDWADDNKAGIWVGSDTNADIRDNTFRNNSYYESGDSTIVNYKGVQKTLAQWLAIDGTDGNTISGERNADPGLKNVGSQEFWPDDSGDDVVGNGYDLGASYDDLLDPDNTDFTASPPVVVTEVQPTLWTIGAYGQLGVGEDGVNSNLNGVILNGIIIN